MYRDIAYRKRYLYLFNILKKHFFFLLENKPCEKQKMQKITENTNL